MSGTRDPALIFRACEMRREGKLLRDIGAALGCRASVVSGWIIRHNRRTVAEIAAAQVPGKKCALTPEREAIIRRMRSERKTIEDIARVIRVSSPTIKRWITKIGLPIFVRGRRPEGEGQRTAAEVAAIDKRILELREQGFGLKEIGHAVGLSTTTVCQRLKSMKRTRHDPHSKPAPDREYALKRRTCLMHGGAFTSTWPGERVCKRCKSTAAWQSGVEA